MTRLQNLHVVSLLGAAASVVINPTCTDAFSTTTTACTITRRRQPTFLQYKSSPTDFVLDIVKVDLQRHHLPSAWKSHEEGNVDAQSELLLVASAVEDEDAKSLSSSLAASSSFSSSDDDAIQKDKEPMSDVVKARLLLLGAAALYGTNFSLVKLMGETGMSVGLSSTLRFGMAALATFPWLCAVAEEHKHRRFQRLFDPNSSEFRAAMAGLEVGMWNSIGYVAQAVGLETTSASKSAFLCALAVVTVPILDYLAGKTLLSRQVIGTLLAVVGVGFLELEGGSSGVAMQALSPGDIASLVQPIAFGLGFWRMESAMGKHPEEAGRATAAQLFAVFMSSAAFLGVMSVTDPASVPALDQLVSWVTDPAILAALFWTGVVTTALTIYMETLALKTLSAAETTLIFSTEPVWGTAFACTVMGETLGAHAVVGAIMILFGCLFSNLGMKGLLSFVPGRNIEAFEMSTNHELEEGFAEYEELPIPAPRNRNVFPKGQLGQFSLKTSVAGVLTGIVATVETATGAPIFVPLELQQFIEKLH